MPTARSGTRTGGGTSCWLGSSNRRGLVTRTMFPTIPPRVDYELTDLGRGLAQPVQALGHLG